MVILFDAVFFAYCWFCAMRGRRKKLAKVVTRLVRKVVSLVVGLGLFKLVGKLLALFLPKLFAMPLGFVIAFAVPFLGIRFLRRRINDYLEKKLEEEVQRKWGAIIGAVSGFINVCMVVIVICASGEGMAYRIFVKFSLFARLWGLILGTG